MRVRMLGGPPTHVHTTACVKLLQKLFFVNKTMIIKKTHNPGPKIVCIKTQSVWGTNFLSVL